MELGADAVQVATRFVTTKECDAPESYKQAYIDAKAEDIVITQSPVGMPGRAIVNPFLEKITAMKERGEKQRSRIATSAWSTVIRPTSHTALPKRCLTQQRVR